MPRGLLQSLAAAVVFGVGCSSTAPVDRPPTGAAATHNAMPSASVDPPSPARAKRWTVDVPARDRAHTVRMTLVDELGLVSAVHPAGGAVGPESVAAGSLTIGAGPGRTLVLSWGTDICAQEVGVAIGGTEELAIISLQPPARRAGDCDAGAVSFAASVTTTRVTDLDTIVAQSRTVAAQSWGSRLKGSDGIVRDVRVVDRTFSIQSYRPADPRTVRPPEEGAVATSLDPSTVRLAWSSPSCEGAIDVEVTDRPRGLLVQVTAANLDAGDCSSLHGSQAIDLGFRNPMDPSSVLAILVHSG